MSKIIMLGTGNGGTLDLYNTCFVIQNEKGVFLVDTGGSVEIVRRLKEANISLTDIKNIFISHSHTDHILGLIWMFKKMSRMAKRGEIKEKINIYCNDVVYEAIKGVSNLILPTVLMDAIYKIANFIVLNNHDKYTINGINYEFFDILAKGTKQFGFECRLNENRLIFLGDETLNPLLNDRVQGADYVMHEAFCLDREDSIFKPREKNHDTVKSACIKAENLGIKNIVLWHTQENLGEKRKELYTKEAKANFSGNVIVPNDLEIIPLN